LLKEAFKEEISKSVSSNFTDTTTSENEPIEENFKNEENKKDFNATETVTDSNTNLCAKTSSMFGTLYVSQCPVNLNSKHKKKGEFPSYINLEEFVDVPENEKKWDCYNQFNEQPNEKIVIETPIQNTIERNSTCQEPDKVGVDFFEKEKLCDLSLPPPHLEKFSPPINKIGLFLSKTCNYFFYVQIKMLQMNRTLKYSLVWSLRFGGIVVSYRNDFCSILRNQKYYQQKI
jgi:hypothetical protein